jgi:hypothetical protein
MVRFAKKTADRDPPHVAVLFELLQEAGSEKSAPEMTIEATPLSRLPIRRRHSELLCSSSPLRAAITSATLRRSATKDANAAGNKNRS